VTTEDDNVEPQRLFKTFYDGSRMALPKTGSQHQYYSGGWSTESLLRLLTPLLLQSLMHVHLTPPQRHSPAHMRIAAAAAQQKKIVEKINRKSRCSTGSRRLGLEHIRLWAMPNTTALGQA
jgi:hypothetical protein